MTHRQMSKVICPLVPASVRKKDFQTELLEIVAFDPESLIAKTRLQLILNCKSLIYIPTSGSHGTDIRLIVNIGHF